MPLYIKDPEVDRMAERLASRRRMTKTEVVKQALRRDLERTEGQADIAEQVAALVRDLKSRAGPGATGKVDRAFIDSLYD